jgi:hypothetical protein
LIAVALRASNARQDVVLFLGVIGVLFGLMAWAYRRAKRSTYSDTRRLVVQILVFAALFRLVVLFVGLPPTDRLDALARDLGGQEPGYQTFLLYDNDIWRYLWDGHLTATGVGPYARTPDEIYTEVEDSGSDAPPLESELWWDVLDNVSFRTYTSVYPPMAELLFVAAHQIAPGSVLVLKLLLALIDLGVCLALAALLRALGRPSRELLFYAWNPLVIKEFAGSGHVDVLMVLFVTLAALLLIRRRQALAQACLGLAIASKLGALILVPIFLRRSRPVTWVLAPMTALLVSLPFLGDIGGLGQGLGTYAREWIFNSGPWVAIEWLFAAMGLESSVALAHLVTKGAAIGVVLWSLRSGRFDGMEFARSCFLTLAVLVVLNPAVMPWYLSWALPFAVAIGNRSWVLLTGLSFLSYLFYVDQGASSWWLWLEYGLFFAIAAVELARRRSSLPELSVSRRL